MKRIAEKSKLINLPPASVGSPGVEAAPTPAASAAPEPVGPPAAVGRGASRSFTGVGAMMAALGQGGALGRELEDVKAKLAEFDGSVPVRLLDPHLIDESAFANRHASEYSSESFAALKLEIAQARVNVQPIKVRPSKAAGRYEIVFGHRRHRACLDLGIEVLSLVEGVSDRELWLQMDQENRGRRDLSPWEQGRSIQNALKTGLFPSVRQLADSAGIDFSNAAKLLKLAELPDDVVAAFQRPTDLQVHWAAPLSRALQTDPDSVLARARAVAARGTVPRVPKSVLAEILGEAAPVGAGDASTPVTLTRDGVTVATVRRGPARRVTIELHHGIEFEEAVRQVSGWLGVDEGGTNR